MPRAGCGGPPRRPPSRQPSGGGRCCGGGWPYGGGGPGPRRPYSQRGGGGGGGTLPGSGPSKTTRMTRPSTSAPSKTSIASKATRRVWTSTSACDLEPFAVVPSLKTLARCTKPQCPKISRRCASVTLRERLRTSSTAGGSLRGDRERPRRGGGERERGRSSRPPRLRPL